MKLCEKANQTIINFNTAVEQKRVQLFNLSMSDLMRKSIHALCLSKILDRHFSMADRRRYLTCTSWGEKNFY
jgi:hypothetical protein